MDGNGEGAWGVAVHVSVPDGCEMMLVDDDVGGGGYGSGVLCHGLRTVEHYAVFMVCLVGST